MQPANEEEKRGESGKKGKQKIKKNKVCKFKKGSYLCSPKRKGRKNERKPETEQGRKLGKEGRNSGRESKKTGSDFRKKTRREGSDFRIIKLKSSSP